MSMASVREMKATLQSCPSKNMPLLGQDLIAEAEPYLIARNQMVEHKFDFAQGKEVIDVVAPSAQATGGIMRKVGDILNGPLAKNTPL